MGWREYRCNVVIPIYGTDCSYLDDCFDLSAAVADSGAKLYECFRATNQLEDYLAKIKDLAILSLKPDNLGTGIGTGLTNNNSN